MNRNERRGFTLIEMIVTIAVFAILASIAVPSGVTFIRNSRLTSNINDLMADLVIARVEASSRGVPVVVCAATSAAACSTAASAWSSGRLIFADTDNDGVFTPATDTLLKYVDGVGGLTLTPDSGTLAGVARIAFTPYGNVGGFLEGAFKLCPPAGSGAPTGRLLSLNLTGRPVTTRINTCP